MDVKLQIIIVGACVIWAIGVLGWRGYRLMINPVSNSCGSAGCGDCPSNSAKNTDGLIQLGPPTRAPVHPSR